MGKVTKFFAASASCALMLGASAFADGFVEIANPAGSIGAGALGINDQGEVTGGYTTDGNDNIGFVGSIDGAFDTFTVNGAPTFARGLNNQGKIVGFYAGDTFINEFERAKDGTITPITKDGAEMLGIVQGINASGEFTGDYVGEPGAVPQRGGFTGKNAAFVADVTLPFPAVRVAPRAINNKGDIAGWFIGAPGDAPQGFVIKGGVTTVLVHPEPNSATFIQGINNKGEMSGEWDDAAGNPHAFVLDADMVSWKTITPPIGDFAQGFGINNLGQVVVNGFGPSGQGMFVYCPKNGGVCTAQNQKAGSAKSAKGKKLNAPDPDRKGADPDTKGLKKGQHRQ
jgi:uncharacterized membrane protein